MQDSALSTAGDILNEMVSLEENYRNESDSTIKKSYADQFKELQVQLNSLTSEKLNGVSLFSSGAQDNMTVYTGSSTTGAKVSLGFSDMFGALSISSSVNLAAATSTASAVAISHIDVTSSSLDNAVDGIAALRAQSGGKLSTLEFADDYLSNMTTNLQSAHSRITDVDIAEETANFAKYSMQYEAAAAAIAQANVAMGAVMDLLLSSINRDR
jgi:flagellin